MNQYRNLSDVETTEERLSSFIFTTVQYIPLLAILVAVGFLIIYFLAQAGLVGNPVWQLLAVTGVVLFVAASQLPIIRFARLKRGMVAYWLYASVMVVASLLFVLFWQGIILVAIFIAWMAPLTLIAVRVRRLQLTLSIIFSSLVTGILILINSYPPVVRLSNDNLAGLAAFILLASTVVLFILATIVVRLLRFRTLQSRLIVSFIFIITVPILFTSAISVLNAFTNSQNQFSNSLQSISALKQDQVDSSIQQSLTELGTLQQGSGQASILYILEHPGTSDQLYQMNTSLASTRIRDFMVEQESRYATVYEEVLVLDTKGKVLLSTYPLDEGLNFSSDPFFQKGSTGYFVGLSKYAGKQNLSGEIKLLISAPFYATTANDVQGVVVLVAKSDGISHILAVTPGFPNAETYLVDNSLEPITKTRSQSGPIRSRNIIGLIKNQSGEGSGIYNNYAGLPVLGYYRWYPAMQVAIIAEIPENDVFNKALSTLLVSSLIGLFTIVIAVVAVISTSRAISEPVSDLAKVAELFSAGQLDTRAKSDQQDEIGNLARSFNKMADQLQGIIGNLERRVSERTQDLERQSLRLRTAAEVARDAAFASDLDELLDRAASLIRDRFSLYHTGIFILDEKKEYAVLRASPTEAGKKMMENNHRLRVGEQGIVGRVASTGEPRIALDTGVDPVYFSNPLLQATRSEMALPLKSAEGMIGVLDIQSDQPEAFTQDDVAIMQVMADQLATAIERTRLLHQVETNLKMMEQTYTSFTEQAWMRFERTGHKADGYKYDNVRLEPIDSLSEGAKSALETGKTQILDRGENHSIAGQSVAVPVRLRGQTIGVINIHFQYNQAPEKTILMVEQIADRLATALENARLLENSMRSANKERIISEITSKIGSSVNIKNVLQTAVEELGRALPGSDVTIQFQTGRQAQGQEK